MAELEDTLGHPEWQEWIAFHALYDLPDGFLVAGQLGALVARVAGDRSARAADFAPFYVPPPAERPGPAPILAFLGQHAKHLKRQPQ